ncbi:iron complex outermembrane receptor protein [Sphingobium fontiphilum]|uniref:Iron complex outermembrane receptor protein n=1 Tax=Sphingobium fontiphilum TaxID=944425 RepID=A0A7W6DEW5_9SPHN|nr:TonB-dependent receptor [Sphingobium fontiphilum]MBB3982000.1 iron complex outermembrane receptor protein [Sphingobium fontiphilum]
MRLAALKLTLVASVALVVSPSWAQPADSAAPQADDAVGGDIVVTARRREERLQDVSVSISAFSSEALERSTVQTISDVKTVAPGFTFSSEGGKDNVALTLRGIGQLPLGEVTPGVVIYLNDTPLPSVGSNVPTYDIGSIQVLKGPQGTLFGRNTLGGAVVIGSQKPSYAFEGYVEGTYGRFDYRELEGAVNIPIIEDKVAFRAAGQVRRQDPRTIAFDGGPGFDNIHQDAYRLSLLVEPFEGLKSTTIYEYFKGDELAGGLYLLRENFPFAALGLGVVEPQVQAALQAQKANRRGSFDGGINGGAAYRKTTSITNDTSFSFGDLTLRNIFGYRKNYSYQLINTGGLPQLQIPTGLPSPAPSAVPFTLFTASSVLDRQYLTNETQLLGDFGSFNFIVGAFYNNDKPDGASGSQFTAFSVGGVPAPAVTAHVRNKNWAVYGQIGYEFTDKLKLNLGARYSWDKVSACGGTIGATYVDEATCLGTAALGLADGVGTVSNKGEEPSWTIGLDYKANPDWLLYIVSRRGYRGVNVNTPLFETPFTTGGADPACVATGGVCADLRPFQKTGEETITDVEIGSKYDYRVGAARGRLNLAAYYSKYKNALQFLNTQTTVPNGTPDSPTNGSLAANVADLRIWGVELEASISPVRSLTVGFNAAYTNVKVESLTIPGGLPSTIVLGEGQINKYSPIFSGTASLSWTLPIRPADGDLVVNADLFMTDDFGGQNGEKLPGYQLANARLDWRGIGGTGLDLGVYVKNLFKENYFSASSVLLPSFPTSSVYAGEPRTWGVIAKYIF